MGAQASVELVRASAPSVGADPGRTLASSSTLRAVWGCRRRSRPLQCEHATAGESWSWAGAREGRDAFPGQIVPVRLRALGDRSSVGVRRPREKGASFHAALSGRSRLRKIVPGASGWALPRTKPCQLRGRACQRALAHPTWLVGRSSDLFDASQQGIGTHRGAPVRRRTTSSSRSTRSRSSTR